jgi:hypothetical protein
MISFCDIPLKTVAQYNKYGSYGIGLKKEWGIKNKLNPILYMEKNSTLTDSMMNGLVASAVITSHFQPKYGLILNEVDSIIKSNRQNGAHSKARIEQLKSDMETLKIIDHNLRHVIYSFYYTKHYSDDLDRNGVITPSYRFYDEREWRYLPEFELYIHKLRYSKEQYEQ